MLPTQKGDVQFPLPFEQLVILASLFNFTAQGIPLLQKFSDQVPDPRQVLFSSLQICQSVFAPNLKPVDTSDLLNQLASLLRRKENEAVNFSLTDESVTVSGQAQLKEQILNIAKPARDSVYGELALASSLQPAGDDDFGEKFVGTNNWR